MGLRLEVAVLEHARHLDDAAQLDLAPAPADVRPVAQGADEVARLAAELLLPLGELANLVAQLGVRARARDLELLQLAVDLLERLLDRGDEMLDRLLALLELLGRLLLELLELGLRELQEGLVVRRERVGRERLHRRLERAARLLERRPSFDGVLGAQHKPGAAAPTHETDEESDDHLGRRTLERGRTAPAGTTKTPAPTNP